MRNRWSGAALRILLLASTLLLAGCPWTNGSASQSTPAVAQIFKALDASSPEELSDILVEEDRRIADVCAAQHEGDLDSIYGAGASEAGSARIKGLILSESRHNLRALLAALLPQGADTSACALPTGERQDFDACSAAIREAFKASLERNDEVALGVRAALGGLESLQAGSTGRLAASIQFSILAVDAYLRLMTSIEQEIERLLADIEIPIPFVGGMVSGIVRAVAREAIAELLALGGEKLIALLERAALIHRPAMVRQACARYFEDPAMGLVASRGLKRIILGADATNRSIEDKCDRLSLVAEAQDTAGLPTGSVTVDFCGALGRPQDVAALARARGGAGAGNEGLPLRDGRPADIRDPREEQPAPQLVAREAAVLRQAAIACWHLTRDDEPNSAIGSQTCNPESFNILGALAAANLEKESGAPPALGSPQEQALTLRLRLQFRVAVRVHEAATSQVARDIDELRGEIARRLAAIEARVRQTSELETTLLNDIAICDDERKRVKQARELRLRELFPDFNFEARCKSPSGHLEWPQGSHDLTLRLELRSVCSPLEPVSATVWLKDGLFDTDSAWLSPASENKLLALEQLPASWKSSDVVVLGHVDPAPFSQDNEKNQETLMEKRAAAVVAWHARRRQLQADAWPGAPTWLPERGDVPDPAICTNHCRKWRTVSLRFATLFPVLDLAKCRKGG
jgi:hypothetical protein